MFIAQRVAETPNASPKRWKIYSVGPLLAPPKSALELSSSQARAPRLEGHIPNPPCLNVSPSAGSDWPPNTILSSSDWLLFYLRFSWRNLKWHCYRQHCQTSGDRKFKAKGNSWCSQNPKFILEEIENNKNINKI